MTGYSMVKNNQKINHLGHNRQTILNTTINDNDKLNVVMVHINPLNYAVRNKLAYCNSKKECYYIKMLI